MKIRKKPKLRVLTGGGMIIAYVIDGKIVDKSQFQAAVRKAAE